MPKQKAQLQKIGCKKTPEGKKAVYFLYTASFGLLNYQPFITTGVVSI